VDTHQFAQFRFTPPLDLSAGDGLVVDVGVGEAQASAAKLYCIVVTSDGGQYITAPGRVLNAAGWGTSQLPWDRFTKAGWVQTGASELDPRAITGVSIGWGGYFGRAGEVIGFTVAAPRVVDP
jgi:hypothetical protein